ncbi:MAG: T9SS type A sorting domain-containing protein [Chitinophagales bacterium]|nr:T9SS type A sorting domain-containing protein [Chitinophagales bacterium]
MKSIITSFLIFIVAGLTAQSTITDTMTHDGVVRNYRLFYPSSYVQGTPMPLVFNLHGFGSDAFQQTFYSEMSAVAETEGFIVCYPNGVNMAWNVGWTFGSTEDDVAFFSRLIDRISSEYSIDQNRVYSCGMSNGGFMSYRLACELSERITAVASVTGSMLSTVIPMCSPSRAVPVLEIHGTADSTVPYTGVSGVSAHIDTVVQFWVNNNGCLTPGDTTIIPNTNTKDSSTVIRVDYTGCNDGSKVSFFVVIGGAHTWPGATLIFDITNKDIDASEEIWEFFKQFSLDNTTNIDEPVSSNRTLIYPNPTSNTISIDAEFDNYRIFDIHGRVIQEGGYFHTLSVKEYLSGMYFLEVSSGSKLDRFIFSIR